ncbi:MAG: hypothetical protein RPU39_14925, partial [Candidatus Sedimenticola sp. (ex Thyasira tokunagai)]
LMKRENLGPWSIYGFKDDLGSNLIITKSEIPVIGINSNETPESIHVLGEPNRQHSIDIIDEDRDGEFDRIIVVPFDGSMVMHELKKENGEWAYSKYHGENTSNQQRNSDSGAIAPTPVR